MVTFIKGNPRFFTYSVGVASGEVEVKKGEFKIGYIDATDFRYELGEAAGGTVIYGSKADLLRCEPCAVECGIIKVKVSFESVVLGEKRDKSYTTLEQMNKPSRQIKMKREHIRAMQLHTGQLLMWVENYKDRIAKLENEIDQLRIKHFAKAKGVKP